MKRRARTLRVRFENRRQRNIHARKSAARKFRGGLTRTKMDAYAAQRLGENAAVRGRSIAAGIRTPG